MESYKTKYKKYKYKYLKLKMQKGGTNIEEIEEKITYISPHCIGRGDYFRQHFGECWSDSIQMLICYSDAIKESVQQKLFNLVPNEIIELAYLKGRNKYLVPGNRRPSITEKNDTSTKYEKRLEKYLLFLQNRICAHTIHSEPELIIPKCRKVDIEAKDDDLYIKYNKFLVSSHLYYDDEIIAAINSLPEDISAIIKPLVKTKPKEYLVKLLTEYLKPIEPKTQLRRQKSEIAGIGSAIIGAKLANAIRTNDSHGAANHEIIVVLNSLSFCLLDDDYVLETNYVANMDLITQNDIDTSFGIFVLTPRHATAMLICNEISMYYDDNSGRYKCEWKDILNKYLEYKNTHDFLLHIDNQFTMLFKNKQSDECLRIDNELNITIVDYKLYGDLKSCIVEGLIFIKKINLHNVIMDMINKTLYDQFYYGNMLIGFEIEEMYFEKLLPYLLTIPIDNVVKILKKYCKIYDKINNRKLAQDIFYKLLWKISDDIEIYKLLINSGVDVNYKYDNNLSPLFILIMFTRGINSYKLINFIIDSGANINEINKEKNKSLLEILIDDKNIDLINIFFEKKVNINVSCKNNNLLLYILNNNKNNDEYDEVSDYEEDEENDDIDDYEEDDDKLEDYKNNEIMKILIKNGIDLMQKDSNNKTALELSIDTKNIDIFEFLLENGVDMTQLFSNNDTVIFYLIEKSRTDLEYVCYVKLLFNYKINVNEFSEENFTPLQIIYLNEKYTTSDYIISKLLLENGADYTITYDADIISIDVDDIEDSKMKKIFIPYAHNI